MTTIQLALFTVIGVCTSCSTEACFKITDSALDDFSFEIIGGLGLGADLCCNVCRYQHYLESVLEGADEFHEIGDLMLRHATLAATNQDLKDQRNHSGEAAEQIRSVMLFCGQS